MLIEPGNFRTCAELNMHFPQRLTPGSGEATSDPLYATWPATLRTLSALLGDALEVASLAADIAESDDPRARYLIGKDAHTI